MIDRADVYKGEVLAGRLVRMPDRVEFSYLPGYRGEPVASTLPVSDEPVVAPAGQLPPFFVGLLPEGRRLSALVRALKVSADDELSLLVAVGADTVGDLRVLPSGTSPSEVEPMVTIDDWDDLDQEELFRRSVGDMPDRVAIPGTQEKVSGRMIAFPASGVSGPVILKLDPPEYRHLSANEHAMLSVAASSGSLPVPERRLIEDREQWRGLVVARFDRSTTDRGVVRFPVEDGCQVLGRYPADKYNLDTIEVIAALAERCSAPAVARLKLAERLVISYLVGDGDLHARNLAIWRGPSGLWEPAPVYDLVCTAVYGDMTLAAPLAGAEQVRELGRARFLEALEAAGLSEKAATGLLDRRVESIARAVADALDSPVFQAFPTMGKVRPMLEKRARLLMG